MWQGADVSGPYPLYEGLNHCLFDLTQGYQTLPIHF